MLSFSVRIAKDDLIFSAAHFLLLGPATCEPLHGHNYRVAAEVHGRLDEHGYVIDFLQLREVLRTITGELDHCVLLPAESPLLCLTVGTEEVEATFAGRRWVFPRSDCRLLPMTAITAEFLAQHIGRRLIEGLVARGGQRPEQLRIEVEESPGAMAVCYLSHIDSPNPTAPGTNSIKGAQAASEG
jgi:6-pyruvoyltetrahydropterin/6-carboxytetrahydropterin synthase